MRPSFPARAAAACLAVLVAVLVTVSPAAARSSRCGLSLQDCTVAKPTSRVPLSAQLRDAAFVGLVRVEAVETHEGWRLPHASPVGEHGVVEALRGARDVIELRVTSCVDEPVWAPGALVLVSGTPGAGGVLGLGPWSARFPLGMKAAREAWAVVRHGAQLAEADDVSPDAWLGWIELLLATPSLRDDGLFELRAILDRKAGALELPRGELLALKPALLALLDEPACSVDPESAELSARLCHDLGWDVSAWVLDQLGRWATEFLAAPIDLGLVELLETARFDGRQRELVVRLRAQHERGDLAATRATAVQLLDSLGWRERDARESTVALSSLDLIPADTWLVRLDGEPFTRDALRAEVDATPDEHELPAAALALAVRHFTLEVFAQMAERGDVEAAWLLELARDGGAEPENEFAMLFAWFGVLSRELWPHYGGRCAIYDIGGVYAYEAMAALLRDRAAAGRLELHPAVTAGFWAAADDPGSGKTFEPDADDTVDTLFVPTWRDVRGGGPLSTAAADGSDRDPRGG